MIINTRRKYKTGVRKKRSSYGTDMINFIDSKVSSHSTIEHEKINEKIKLLIKIHPGFRLYEEWLEKAERKQLSQKEVDKVHLHFYNL